LRKDSGWAYLVQLEPVLDPCRYTLGFASDLDKELETIRATAPFAVCLAHWPAQRTWERTAIASITQTSICIRDDVFLSHSPDLAPILAAADRFFALLPQPPLECAAPPIASPAPITASAFDSEPHQSKEKGRPRPESINHGVETPLLLGPTVPRNFISMPNFSAAAASSSPRNAAITRHERTWIFSSA
jgi:hypothetical protein